MIGLRLAAADLAREPLMFACQVAAICAVIAPLLVLLGLKSGVVDGLLEALRNDPGNLRIAIRGNHAFRPADIERMRTLPGVGFLSPATRSIAARAYFESSDTGQVERVGLQPSGPGDPLLPSGTELQPNRTALPAALAERLSVGIGDIVVARNERGDARNEYLDLPLEVFLVLPDSQVTDRTALVHPDVIEAIEAFLDGFAVPQSQFGGRPLSERPILYENVRLYARALHDVAPLAAALEGAFPVETISAEAEIKQIQGLDRDLTLVFTLVAVIAGTGLALATAAQIWANVERKRRHLSVVRLLGCSGATLLAFPLVQGVIVVVAAVLVSYAAYFGIASIINTRFAGSLADGAAVCAARPIQLAGAGFVTLAGSLLAALVGGLRARRIEPVEGMREL